MCGRFALSTPPKSLAEHFKLEETPELLRRYNIAPTQDVAVVRQRVQDGKRKADLLKWGLVPHWSKDAGASMALINARSETAAVKPAFRTPMKRRRCIIPADGYFEWKKEGARKQPYFIRLREGGLMAFAGLWDRWEGPGGDALETCTILTVDANESLKEIHDRMPVILEPGDYSLWLDSSIFDADRVTRLLRSLPPDLLTSYPVSTLVNNPRFDDEKCIQPIEYRE
jgi:putative SOS response-associated peptidase YedK